MISTAAVIAALLGPPLYTLPTKSHPPSALAPHPAMAPLGKPGQVKTKFGTYIWDGKKGSFKLRIKKPRNFYKPFDYGDLVKSRSHPEYGVLFVTEVVKKENGWEVTTIYDETKDILGNYTAMSSEFYLYSDRNQSGNFAIIFIVFLSVFMWIGIIAYCFYVGSPNLLINMIIFCLVLSGILYTIANWGRK
jgi:hypothetical protein